MVSKFTLFFVKKYRLTALIAVAVLVLGALAYTTFLKREGFPEINFPIGTIQATYFVNDDKLVAREITDRLELIVVGYEGVQSVTSVTTPNGTSLVVQFDEGVDSKAKLKEITDEIKNSGDLPEQAEIMSREISVEKIAGKYDLLLALASENNYEQTVSKARKLKEVLDKSAAIKEAEVVKYVTQEVNPVTGEIFEFRSGFGRTGIYLDGELRFLPSVSIGVLKNSEEQGDIEFSDAVQDAIDRAYAEGVLDDKYEVIFSYDVAEDLRSQISSLEENAFSGLIAVSLILLLIINWRSSLITAIFIPLVLCGTFALLYLLGFTLNVISLFALILVLGLFVDDAIVVVEAIDYFRSQGEKPLAAIKHALNAVGGADIMGSLTTILVFAPLAFISGILGSFIIQIPITVILALTCSLLIALSIIPMLARFMIIGSGNISRKIDSIISFPGLIVNAGGVLLQKFVDYYLRHKIAWVLVMIATICLIAIGGYFASLLEFSIFPAAKDTDMLLVNMVFPEQTDIATAEEKSKQVETIIKQNFADEIIKVSYITASSDNVEMYIYLTSFKQRDITSARIAEVLNEEIAKLSGVTAKVSPAGVGPGESEFPFAMQVFSEDQQLLEAATADVKQEILEMELANDITIREVVVDNLSIITRKDGRRFAQVKARFNETPDTNTLLEVSDRLKNEYDKERLAEMGLEEDALGFDLGQETYFLDSFNSAVFMLFVALIVMYGLLVFQYDSFLQPLLIFLAIPFSFMLLFPGLYITNNALSFFVVIGMAGLAGIVVNNTIMLVDFANQERTAGKGIREAIATASRRRFRALLTTSATTVAGLLPLALTDPFWESLALTIVFGLVSSTMLVVTAFPAFYALVEGFRSRKSKLLRRLSF